MKLLLLLHANAEAQVLMLNANAAAQLLLDIALVAAARGLLLSKRSCCHRTHAEAKQCRCHSYR
jgi:hypothetical protein